jgi:hypothetical protein
MMKIVLFIAGPAVGITVTMLWIIHLFNASDRKKQTAAAI